MSRVILALFVLTAFFTASNANGQKPADKEATVKKAPTAAELLVKKLEFSKEVTRVTKHRREDGLPDYAAAINDHFGKGVTPEENGAVLYYQAIGPAPEGSPMDDRFFDLLGMPRPPAKGDYFRGFGRDLPPEKVQELLETEFNVALERPWKSEEFPAVARWLRKNTRPVATAIKAAYRPKYYSPLIVPVDKNGRLGGLIECLLPGIQESRSIARYLICRAHLNIAEGNADAAWSDLMACHRLGSMIARGPTLIESLVGIAINSMAARGDIVFLDQIEMDAAQLARCRRDIEKLPPIRSMVEQLDWCERMMYLDSVLLLGTGRTEVLNLISGLTDASPEESALDSLATRLAILSIDWNTAMRIGNQMYDRLIVSMNKKTYQQREVALKEVDRLIKKTKENTSVSGFLKAVAETGSSRTAMSEMTANVMISLLLPAVRAVNTAHARSQQTRHNLEVAFALAEWKLKNGSYPRSLDQLVPKHLDEAPFDTFSGKPLKYIPRKEGFLIYSVGQNGEDEGGRWYDDEPQGDDPRVRIPIPEEELLREDP